MINKEDFELGPMPGKRLIPDGTAEKICKDNKLRAVLVIGLPWEDENIDIEATGTIDLTEKNERHIWESVWRMFHGGDWPPPLDALDGG